MKTTRLALFIILVAIAPSLQAQSPSPARSPSRAPAVTAPVRDTTDDDDEHEHQSALRFGVAGGALEYVGGRTEQAAGVVIRWVPLPWLSFSATPTTVRAREPAVTSTLAGSTTSGLTDLPLELSLSKGFTLPLKPSFATTLGVSLPVGDTASGLGAGEVGYSMSVGVGFAPAEAVWMHVAAGRSLAGVTAQSAFSSGTGWGDVSAGVSVTERFSVSGGYSTDLGAVDPTIGRSTSLGGGLSFAVRGANTINLNVGHRLTGAAPVWSIALGIGTAFPYLSHLGAGSAVETLQDTFGGGTHGLGKGKGTGTGST
ncbi:MAG: transporter, partial [Gemmatimonadaceae bacterium]|nr:transporter [Gemmatimonadaceae bacterium]